MAGRHRTGTQGSERNAHATAVESQVDSSRAQPLAATRNVRVGVVNVALRCLCYVLAQTRHEADIVEGLATRRDQ